MVVESDRRIHRETSYGFVHALWWIDRHGRGAVISVPPGAADLTRKITANVDDVSIDNVGLVEQVRVQLNRFLSPQRSTRTDRHFQTLIFACSATTLVDDVGFGEAFRLYDPDTPTVHGLVLPNHCLPDGIVYGVYHGQRVAAVAYAHKSGVMEGRVADLAVETALEYRRKGYGKAVVAAIVRHICSVGGEARYSCSPDNYASAATARSVGFMPFARSLTFAARL